MEALIALFALNSMFGCSLLSLIIVLWLADLYESNIVVLLATSCFIGINYYYGNNEWETIFTYSNVAIYVVCGFLFSVFRTFMKGRWFNERIKRAKDMNNDVVARDWERIKKNFDLKDHVFRWWLLFPICIINWIFGTMLIDLFNGAWKFMKGFYARIYDGKIPIIVLLCLSLVSCGNHSSRSAHSLVHGLYPSSIQIFPSDDEGKQWIVVQHDSTIRLVTVAVCRFPCQGSANHPKIIRDVVIFPK